MLIAEYIDRRLRYDKTVGNGNSAKDSVGEFASPLKPCARFVRNLWFLSFGFDCYLVVKTKHKSLNGPIVFLVFFSFDCYFVMENEAYCNILDGLLVGQRSKGLTYFYFT